MVAHIVMVHRVIPSLFELPEEITDSKGFFLVVGHICWKQFSCEQSVWNMIRVAMDGLEQRKIKNLCNRLNTAEISRLVE